MQQPGEVQLFDVADHQQFGQMLAHQRRPQGVPPESGLCHAAVARRKRARRSCRNKRCHACAECPTRSPPDGRTRPRIAAQISRNSPRAGIAPRAICRRKSAPRCASMSTSSGLALRHVPSDCRIEGITGRLPELADSALQHLARLGIHFLPPASSPGTGL